MPTLSPARFALNADGTPWSDAYDDVYHSASGAMEQAEHVFLHGNGLPERWRGRERFVIVETGFGLGNNFLATWAAWQKDPAAPSQLHFISLEKHPFTAKDLIAGHAASGMPQALAEKLAEQWPLPLPGCHRLEFEAGRIKLTLFFGEAHEMLRQMVARADAIFLDGFSPARNPEMWSPEIFRALGGLSDEHTTLATWSVSGQVREGLQQAGFLVKKTQGFGSKREMLRGHFRASRPRSAAPADQRVLVIGAGLAGTAIAERLAQRGLQIELIEAQEDIAQGASGNLAGAFRPLPSKDDNRISRITRAGFLYGLQHLSRLKEAGQDVLWEPCGVLHLARNQEQEAKQREVVSSQEFPPEYLSWVSSHEATRYAGHTASHGGWWFPQGGWIQPYSLCQANLGTGGEQIRLHTGLSVATLLRHDEQWCALATDGSEIARASRVVLANAHDARRLANAEWLPLRAARGQVSHLPMAQLAPLGVVVCGQGYITPGIGGHAALGASFVVDDFDLTLREDEHAENMAKLGRMLPDVAHALSRADLEGRVSLRPVSLDRLPMVGRLPSVTDGTGYNLGTLPRQEGLWILTGFGARGLVWSSLCGELLAAQMCNEPLPLERELVDAMDPGRFVISPPYDMRFPSE